MKIKALPLITFILLIAYSISFLNFILYTTISTSFLFNFLIPIIGLIIVTIIWNNQKNKTAELSKIHTRKLLIVLASILLLIFDYYFEIYENTPLRNLSFFAVLTVLTIFHLKNNNISKRSFYDRSMYTFSICISASLIFSVLYWIIWTASLKLETYSLKNILYNIFTLLPNFISKLLICLPICLLIAILLASISKIISNKKSIIDTTEIDKIGVE